MTAATPKQVVEAWIERFNAGDAAGLAELYHADAVNHQVTQDPIEGRSAIRAMFEREFAVADMVCIPEAIHEAGDVAALEWRDPLGLRGCGFFTVRDGLIQFQRGYWDKLSFLKMHGLPVEQPLSPIRADGTTARIPSLTASACARGSPHALDRQEFLEAGLRGMMKIRTLTAVTAVSVLAACSTMPPPPPPPAPVVAQPRSVAPPTNYRWTNGFSEKGYEAMYAAFGKVHLKPGEHHWTPNFPVDGDVNITIDIANQIAFVFKGEKLIGVTNVSTGKKGHPTPLGFWTINWKKPKYFSRKYDNAPMPWIQNIDDKGIAMHGGVTPGYPASHGCIRLPMTFAKQLYALTKPGNKVVIEG